MHSPQFIQNIGRGRDRVVLAGKVFNRVTVLEDLPRERNVSWVRARCWCGNEFKVRSWAISSGKTKSCGCGERAGRHGHAGAIQKTPTYRVWVDMKRRCQNPGNDSYPNYGGRGIKVCERWQAFDNFLADMGERPAGLSLDRIDVNGNYEPGNCRWVTMQEQARNRRTNVFVTIGDERKCLAEWCERLGANPSTAAWWIRERGADGITALRHAGANV